jgi:hypothetical protein
LEGGYFHVNNNGYYQNGGNKHNCFSNKLNMDDCPKLESLEHELWVLINRAKDLNSKLQQEDKYKQILVLKFTALNQI